MTICNREIRQLIFDKGIKYWQVAEALSMTDSTFSKKLRRELSEGDKNRIKIIIENIESSN